ncbi:ARM repeat superfamily protein [Striga asiatica]|uniref:ARM repeat superfamily protein n=1 Tax=Striga asiatica TaxID=4170 RepID=A0A5A7R9C2_STRAF|nr:ARM repeat superfamily protein [Striga asiatica]
MPPQIGTVQLLKRNVQNYSSEKMINIKQTNIPSPRPPHVLMSVDGETSPTMALEREMEEGEEDDEDVMLKRRDRDDDGGNSCDAAPPPSLWSRKMVVEEVARVLTGGDLKARIEAARDVRRLVRKSTSVNSKSAVRCRFAAAGVIEPLVSMLHVSFPLAAREAALLALLNLAARNQSLLKGVMESSCLEDNEFRISANLGNHLDELKSSFLDIDEASKNKISIVTTGAVPPLLDLLKHQADNLRELSAAAILSLSSAPPNKPTITASGAHVQLVRILCTGSVQGRVDAVTALYNLSTSEDEPKPNLDPSAVPPLIDLLKECKKYSKFAEKASFLLEIFSGSEEGRNAITESEGGILTLVETVEDGSSFSMLYAVGALLSLCRSSRDKYRELILNEGAIPGLLRLTAEGTPTAQDRARSLLDLLRDSPPEKRLTMLELERIVYDFAAHIDGKGKAVETAKRLLHDMAQKSAEAGLSRVKIKTSS